jgi:hypothetical protein
MKLCHRECRGFGLGPSEWTQVHAADIEIGYEAILVSHSQKRPLSRDANVRIGPIVAWRADV